MMTLFACAIIGLQTSALPPAATEEEALHLPIVVITTVQPTNLDIVLLGGVLRGPYVSARTTALQEMSLKGNLARAKALGYGSARLKDPTGRQSDFLVFYPKDTFGFDDVEKQIRLMKAIPAALHDGDRLDEKDLSPENRMILRGMGYSVTSPDYAKNVSTKREVGAQLGVGIYLDYPGKNGTQTFLIDPKMPDLKEIGKYDTGPEHGPDIPDSEKATPLSQNLTYVFPLNTPDNVKLKLEAPINEFIAKKMEDLTTRYGEAEAVLLSLAKTFDADFLKAFTSEGFDPTKLDSNQHDRVMEAVWSGNRAEFPTAIDADAFVRNTSSTGYRFQVMLTIHSISNIGPTGYTDDQLQLPLRSPYGN